MGNKPAGGAGGATTKPVCEDCDKKHQKDLPTDDATSSRGGPCDAVYKNVTDCMNQHHGQVAPCVKEWDAFRICHIENK
jgi:hypothetical protein